MDYLFLDSDYFSDYEYILKGDRPKASDLKNCGNYFQCHEFIYDFDLNNDIDKSKLFYVIYVACDF